MRICVGWRLKKDLRNTCYEVDMGFPGADYYTIEAVEVGTALKTSMDAS
jgi:hypothetical protein